MMNLQLNQMKSFHVFARTAALNSMASNAKVVITAAGPFSQYGSLLVKCCAGDDRQIQVRKRIHASVYMYKIFIRVLLHKFYSLYVWKYVCMHILL